MKFIDRSIFFFLIIFSTSLVAQEGDGVFSGVDFASKKNYKLFMQNGDTYRARIICLDEQRLMLMNIHGETYIIDAGLVSEIKAKPYNSIGSLGFGYGLPYGTLGFNADIHIFQSLYLTGGAGTANFRMPLYSFGGKYYLRSGDYKLRPRLSAYYGTYGIVFSDRNYYYGEKIRQRYYSPTIGAGFQWALGIADCWAMDFDVHYILNKSPYIEDTEMAEYGLRYSSYTKFTLSFGVRYCF